MPPKKNNGKKSADVLVQERDENADDLIITPVGLRPRGLVRQLKPGEIVRPTRRHADDSADGKASTPQTREYHVFTTWKNTTGKPITFFSARWKVPPPPTVEADQILYLFNGLQTTDQEWILQPVLQWGETPNGGGNYWAVSSWYVGNDGTTRFSKLVKVSPGDTLTGIMTQMGEFAEDGRLMYVNYGCCFEGMPDTCLQVQSSEELPLTELTECMVAFETHKVTSCDQRPHGTQVIFDQINVRGNQQTLPLVWTPVAKTTTCNESVTVVIDGPVNGRVDLFLRGAGKPSPVISKDRLVAGQGLLIDQSLVSDNGRLRLTLQGDGNVVLYTVPGGYPVYSWGTQGHPEVWDFELNNDSNMLLVDVDGKLIWSYMANYPGAWLQVRNQGDVVLHGVSDQILWSTNTSVPQRPDAGPARKDLLKPGQGLLAGQSLFSDDGMFEFKLHTDGNLVLYGPSKEVLWASNTANHPDAWCFVLQKEDCNLVMYDIHGTPYWSPNISGNYGELIVQNDGNVVLYLDGGTPWGTNTGTPARPNPPSQRDRLKKGEGLLAGQSIVSSNGRFEFIVQPDGNLVLYYPGERPFWSNGKKEKVWNLLLQSQDGNCVLYDIHNNVLFATDKYGTVLLAQDDGNVVLWDESTSTAVWSTGTSVPQHPKNPSERGMLHRGEGIIVGQPVTSPDGRYRLELERNGDLVFYGPPPCFKVLYRKSIGNDRVWDAYLKDNGDFVICDVGGTELWSAGTSANGGLYLSVNNGGICGVYNAKGKRIWTAE